MLSLVSLLPAWFELIALAVCTGVIVCRLWILPSEAAGAGRASLSPGMSRLFGAAVALLFAASVAGLFVRTSEMGGRPLAETLPLIGTVLFRTHFGRAWLTRCAALAALGLAAAVGTRRRDTTRGLLLLMVLALVVAMTESAGGHAADAGDFSVRETVDWLHLLAASTWGGSIMVLSVVVLPEAVRAQDRPFIVAVSRRFSVLARLATVVLVLTAIFGAATAVGWSVPSWRTPYGLKVVGKILLFFFLLDLVEWKGARAEEDPRPFLSSLRVGAFLIIGALFLAAALKHDIPGRHAAHLSGGGHGSGHEGHH